ncbi:MAG TPA: amidohydrolase family protein [Acidobacteriota bacterium]|nr:amidohydrolase family protein [Acidobacteriota bacterium]
MKNKPALLSICLFVHLILLVGPIPAQDLVIRDVAVIEVETGAILEDRTVTISQGRIASVSSALPDREGEDLSPETQVVEGRGRYLIPGLWDMHVHIQYQAGWDRYFPLLVAHGVTGVRDMNGPLSLAEIRRLREEIESGERLGPRFVTPGPLVDGPGRSPNARGPGTVVVETPEQAHQAVADLKEKGADFIKVYNALPRELFSAVMEEAARQGIPVAGHIPLGVSADQAARAGLASAEHLNNVLESVSARGPELFRLTRELIDRMAQGTQPQDLPPELTQQLFAARKGVVRSYDPEKARRLYALFAHEGTWQCPTLVSNRALDLAAIDSSFQEDERLKWFPQGIRDSWKQGARRHPYRADPEERRLRFELIQRAVREMHQAGVRFLAGTDLGVAYVFPGSSLHDELELLVSNGLSPLEALRAATLNPAIFLGRTSDLSSVAPGKLADLVLLEGNPLEDIANIRRINAVVLNGRLLRKERLRTLVDEIVKSTEEDD